jgi:hypothetical protein
VRKAILPTIGHVANRICTAIKARCGAVFRLDFELCEVLTNVKRSGTEPDLSAED